MIQKATDFRWLFCGDFSQNSAAKSANHGKITKNSTEEEGFTVILGSCIDLSPSREEVERMVGLCNTLDLAINHFWDVVEDFVVIH